MPIKIIRGAVVDGYKYDQSSSFRMTYYWMFGGCTSTLCPWAMIKGYG